jgi:hypothetical protein
MRPLVWCNEHVILSMVVVGKGSRVLPYTAAAIAAASGCSAEHTHEHLLQHAVHETSAAAAAY